MPIPVVCASCQTRLNAPDAAAGKKVKCPKCQAVMAVPAGDEPPPLPPPPAAAGTPFDFGGGSPPPPPSRRSAAPPPPPEPEAPPAPAGGGGGAFDFGAAVSAGGGGKPPRGDREERGGRGESGERRRRREEGDDAPPPDRGDRPRRRPRDDDDAAGDDDRPRGRGGKPSGGGKFPWALVLGGLMVLLLLCCGGPTGVYFFVIAPKVKEAAKKLEDDLKKIGTDANKGAGGSSAAPIGWVAFEPSDKAFKAYFPRAPEEESQTVPGPKTSTPTIKKYTAGDPVADDQMVGLIVMKFPAGATAAQKTTTMDRMATGLTQGAKGEAKDVTWLGKSAKEVLIREPGGAGEMVVRQVLVGNTAFVGMVGFKAARKQDVVDGFFNTVEAK